MITLEDIFYGPTTDIKVKKSYMAEDGSNYWTIELKFSNLSQSTQTEIPRIAVLTATIPPGTKNALMLVGGTSGAKWRKGRNKKLCKQLSCYFGTQK